MNGGCVMEIDQTRSHNFTKEIVTETIKILQELIRIDTTNPPGNETKAAEWIQSYLSKEGIDAEVIESAPGRGNVISRLKGSSGGSSLLLLSHIDVVPSQDVEKWEVPPFSGDLKERFIWGRGAVDCKGTTAPQLMTYIQLHRDGFKPKGDIVFAATADEESGGHFGPGWLVENKFDLIKADNVVSEGGGQLMPLKSKNNNYIIQIAEKSIYWTKIKTRGIAGHGSIPPNSNETAIVKMMKIIQKMARYKEPIIIQEIFKDTINSIDLPGGGFSKKLITSKRFVRFAVWLAEKLTGEDLKDLVLPLVENKMTPTIIRAGDKENNIPGVCETTLDCRLLPGYDRVTLYEELKKIFGKKLFAEVELVTIEDQPGGLTPINTDFYERIKQTIQKLDPKAKLVPILSPGSTDLLHFRKKGIQAYGFVPMLVDEGLTTKIFKEMIHGYNERLSIGNLMFATRFFYDLSQQY
jgi:acetylornithine deacetylase/succinyl-diaminopimelate desuccinylase-like protein